MGPLCHPRGSSQQPRFIEEGTGAALSEPVLGWGESGYSNCFSPLLSWDQGRWSPCGLGVLLALLPGAPRPLSWGPAQGPAGREAESRVLMIWFCLCACSLAPEKPSQQFYINKKERGCILGAVFYHLLIHTQHPNDLTSCMYKKCT